MNALWDWGLKLRAPGDRVLDKPMGGLIGAHNAWGANGHRRLRELLALSSIEISEQDRPSGRLHCAMARRSQRPKTQAQWRILLSRCEASDVKAEATSSASKAGT